MVQHWVMVDAEMAVGAVAGSGRADAVADRARWPGYLAWTSLVVTEAAVVTAIVAMTASGLSWRTLFPSYAVTNAWLAATFAPLGAIVAARRPRLSIGWWICAYAFAYGVAAAGISLAFWSLAARHFNIWSAYAGWIGISIWTLGAALFLPLVIVLFPDGRLPSPRWRWFVGVVVVGGVLWLCGWATDPSQVQGTPWPRYVPTLSGSWGRAAHWTDSTLSIGGDLFLFLAVVGLFVRWRGSVGRERSQTTWLLWGVTIALLLEVPTDVQSGPGTVWASLLMIGFPVLPAAAAVALLRYQLLDIDLVVNRTLVYVGLTAGVLATYLGVIALGRAALRHDPGLAGSLVAAVAVAVAFAPARELLQRRVDLLLYGERRDPVRALTTVNAVLQRTAADELTSAVQAVSDSLRLAHALVEVEGRRIGSAGPAGAPVAEVPLTYRSETVGRLLAWPRRAQTELDRADFDALAVVAGPLAAAVNAVRLNDQLQQAREELITDRENERDRLRQDLHDGLGPALTGVALKVDAAGNLLATNPSEARRLMAELSDEVRQTIADVRRIAHDLQPPSLDDLGLVGALRHEASKFTSRLDGHPLVVTVDAPGAVPLLAPAVEATAYRIAAEALTNVARHSSAFSVEVRIRSDDALHLDIVDNGAVNGERWQPGFGLVSMRRRVLDLGGRLEFGPTDRGGRLHAEIPLEQTENEI
jgi:signal transduction histidine kinase